MKIIREGKEIELTFNELRSAYAEINKYYTLSDLKERFQAPEDESVLNEFYERFKSYIESNDSFWDLYWGEITSVAIEYGLKELD